MEQTEKELWVVAAEFYKLKSEGENPVAQYLDRNNIWCDYYDRGGLYMPNFNDGDKWRLKPELVKHKGGEYPAPCTDPDALLNAEKVYLPDYLIDNGIIKPCAVLRLCSEASVINNLISVKLAYLTEEDALARAKVIYEID